MYWAKATGYMLLFLLLLGFLGGIERRDQRQLSALHPLPSDYFWRP